MKKKNILFLFPDQHRGDWMPYGDDVFASMGVEPLPLRVPHLRELMDQGTTFTHTATNSPLCVPARACLASGMHYNHCGAFNNRFCYPIQQKTFYSVLRDGGYQVGGVGKFDLHKPILYWDQSGWIDQLGQLGFTCAVDSEGKYDTLWTSYYEPNGPYGKFLHDQGLMKDYCRDYIKRYYNTNDSSAADIREDAYADNWVTSNALAMLRKMEKKEQPWFLMVNFSGPHDPWDVTEDMKERWKDVQFPIPADYDGDREELNGVRQNYAAMLENIDRNIGLLVEELKRSGQYDNTIIIYASDHGEMMGDRSRYFKCVPYHGSIHVPLVISGPGVRQGAVRDELVQLHDLAATITDFAGLSMPEGADAKSLVPLATSAEAGAIRDFQAVMLCNGIQNTEKRYDGYEEYLSYQKKMTDFEYIAEFNREFQIPESSHSSTKMKTQKNWKSIITKEYKLIEYLDGTAPELYDVQADLWEHKNLAAEKPEIVEQLRSLYDFELPVGIME